MQKFSSRRRFLFASTIATLGVGASLGVNKKMNLGDRWFKTLSTLQSMVDTIVPSGIISSDQLGALDLKLDKAIQHLAENEPRFNALLERLTNNVEKIALHNHKSSFSTLDIDQREALLTSLTTQTAQPQLRRDLNTFRNAIMHRFYTTTQGQRYIGYAPLASYPNY